MFIWLFSCYLSEEMSGKQRGGREKTLRQYFKKDTVGKRVGEGRQSSEKGSVILLEPGEGAAHTYTLQADT